MKSDFKLNVKFLLSVTDKPQGVSVNMNLNPIFCKAVSLFSWSNIHNDLYHF